MPQENALHNLLFLLQHRKKRREGHQQSKPGRKRGFEEDAWAEKKDKPVTPDKFCAGRLVWSSDRRARKVSEIQWLENDPLMCLGVFNTCLNTGSCCVLKQKQCTATQRCIHLQMVYIQYMNCALSLEGQSQQP